VYLLFQTEPWFLFNDIPGVPFLSRYYSQAMDWAVQQSNTRVFRVWDTLVQPNGSGDTSWAFTQMWMLLGLAAIACAVWSGRSQTPVV
jgi:hypothetical protein